MSSNQQAPYTPYTDKQALIDQRDFGRELFKTNYGVIKELKQDDDDKSSLSSSNNRVSIKNQFEKLTPDSLATKESLKDTSTLKATYQSTRLTPKYKERPIKLA